ncbi:hypothetical protein J2Z23_004382 [Lederbergia galactosidilyticus]|uniref:anti sigma factor C-terminal domain-containing protein n=1 Tax=Lederbergia galactosidilytica TaxID=217031 RepID=UPI001AE1AFB0|nr:anti sigma factor C-terminal domain-containing protein [Lederbergia galactosidilytica]MBP1917380.1 hypothetical protein [Lederbergia galactosidilytica]
MKDKSIFAPDDSFSALIKRAKRKSLKRSITISIFVTIGMLILLWGFLYVGQYFMYERMDKDVKETTDYTQMVGANVYPGGGTYDHFFIASTSNVSAYKEVNGHIINWHSTSTFHTIFGTKSTLNTSTFQEVNHATYNNNYKMVKFHLPNVEAVHNDVDYLESLPDFYSVEVALSFDEELTLEEVYQTFPTASWLWVASDQLKAERSAESKNSSAFKGDFSEINGDDAVGFPVDPTKPFMEGAEQYLFFLKGQSNKLVGAKDVLATMNYQNLNEIPIAGVILTGTVEEILPYTKKQPVRVVRTGVIIPY